MKARLVLLSAILAVAGSTGTATVPAADTLHVEAASLRDRSEVRPLDPPIPVHMSSIISNATGVRAFLVAPRRPLGIQSVNAVPTDSTCPKGTFLLRARTSEPTLRPDQRQRLQVLLTRADSFSWSQLECIFVPLVVFEFASGPDTLRVVLANSCAEAYYQLGRCFLDSTGVNRVVLPAGLPLAELTRSLFPGDSAVAAAYEMAVGDARMWERVRERYDH
jgi:hypothetical protein